MITSAIHPRWYELPHMAELTEYLQSVPSHELTKRIALEIAEEDLVKNPRGVVNENFILVSRQFMRQLFEEIETDLEKHSQYYPFLTARIPRLTYESTDGRETYQKLQSFLGKMPLVGKKYRPMEIRNPIVPIVLPGVDYSAESLVYSSSLAGEEFPDKSRLGWQHLDAYADYCLDVMALGRETYASLADGWYFENDSDRYFKGLETLAEEMLHHVSDEIAGPRYGERAVQREHYWMKSYGEFPERVDIALLRLKDEYVGKLKESFRLHPESRMLELALAQT